jgi:tetratricopeptide (TPR) repeat protein
LLTLFAFLNPDEILVEFLQAGKEGLDDRLKQLVADPCIFDELLTSLCNFSLIQRFQQKKSIAIHRLVQAIIKEGLKSEERKIWRNTTIALCAKAFPPVRQKDILLHRRFQSQVTPCITDPSLENSDLLADLLSRMGWYMDCEAQHGVSAPLYQRAIEIYRRVHGERSKELFINMDRLAWNYMKQGRIVEATHTYQEAFSSLCTVLGEEHDDTLACQRNYGVALLKQGEIEKGMSMLKRACTKQREVLGDDNPRTHATMRKFAAAYMQQDNIDEAIVLLEIVYLSAKRDPRGTFHSVQCELGWAYCQTNRLADGTQLLENARTLQRNALGNEHPDTLKSCRYLACAYVLQGSIAEGTVLLEQTCEKQKRQLGLEHEETLLSMQYLATVYRDQGRPKDPCALETTEVLNKHGLKSKSLII